MNNIQEIKTITSPLTIKEIQDMVDNNDGDTYITAIVPIDLGFIIDNDLEDFLDEISEKLVDNPLFMDISYKIVGSTQENEALIQVTGDVSAILDFEQHL